MQKNASLNEWHQPDRKLDVLDAIARVLSHRSAKKVMIDEVLAVLEQRLGMIRGTIMLVSQDGAELMMEAALGREPLDNPQARYQRGEGITGHVMQTGRPALIPHIRLEPRFQGRVHGPRDDEGRDLSFICVPILVENEVAGTLSVDLPYESMEMLASNERLLAIVACMIANNVQARRIAKRDRLELEAENLRLRGALGEHFRPSNIIGNSPLMEEVYLRIRQVAESDATVLIRGESGTGKELVASAIHYGSKRKDKPFVRVNCAQLNENLFESELFGHERGAFTGAIATRLGRLEEAGDGTIFLDEIGDFPLSIQVKLLRVLQEREFQRVGSNKTIHAGARILTATNRPLEKLVDQEAFRQDLYYRINVFPIELPPLRERKMDIPTLADHFAAKHGRAMNRPIARVTTTAINMMLAYHWPGNVRELENSVEHAVLLSTDGVIHGQNLPPTLQMPENAQILQAGTLLARVAIVEKDMIIDALKRHGGSVALAAETLGITPRMVRYKIKNLGIQAPRVARGRRPLPKL